MSQSLLEDVFVDLQCPTSLLNFPPNTVVVEDADEEIMELYMQLASIAPTPSTSTPSTMGHAEDSGGLGFYNPKEPIITLEIDLRPPQLTPAQLSSSAGEGMRKAVEENIKSSGRARKKVGKKVHEKEEVMALELIQDLGALRNRKGDTGSLLWRSSLYLAQNILIQSHLHPPSPILPLLSPDRLRKSRVLELGAGTGLLSILLSPLCASYTVTDLYENLGLIQKNLERNCVSYNFKDGGGMKIEEIDWVEISARSRSASTSKGSGGGEEGEGYDLILAVDCIYNENLIQPLVDTLSYYAVKGKTMVWVIVELRSSDVMTRFLEAWLGSGDWRIVRLGEGAMGTWNGARGRWVGWVGWRV